MPDDLINETGVNARKLLLMPFLGIGALLIAYVAFGDEVKAFFESQQRIDNIADDLIDANAEIGELKIKTAAHDRVIIDLLDFQGDTTDEMARRRDDIDQNTQNHVEQKQRATVRIGEHIARDERNSRQDARLNKLEAYNDANTKKLIAELERRVKELERSQP